MKTCWLLNTDRFLTPCRFAGAGFYLVLKRVSFGPSPSCSKINLMTQADDYARITQIIQDQMQLERQRRKNNATFKQIEDSRVNAYQQIVHVVTGVDIFAQGCAVS